MNSEKEEKLFSLVDDFVNDMKKSTGDNYDYSEIVYYIVEHFENWDVNETFNCAKYLVLTCNYTKDEILNHEADDKIKDFINYQKAKKSSVEEKENLTKPVSKRGIHLKAKREKTPKEKFKQRLEIGLLIAGIGTLSILYAVRSHTTNNMLEKEIGRFASHGKTIESIVEQATDSLGYNPQVGHVEFDYREDIIAGHLEDMLEKNPNVLDDVLHSIYTDLEQNRLYNMDTIMARLRLSATNNGHLQEVKDKIDSCQSFLDYVVKSGRIQEFCTPNVLEAISKYNALNHLQDPMAFYNLSIEDQNALTEFMDVYRESKSITYNDSLASIQQMNQEGSRNL